MQLTLIIGGALTTILGALQVSFPDITGLGICEGVLAILLTGIALWAQQMKSQERYFTNRLKAERLRGEYFLFLGKIGAYEEEQDRYQNLIQRVDKVVKDNKDE